MSLELGLNLVFSLIYQQEGKSSLSLMVEDLVLTQKGDWTDLYAMMSGHPFGHHHLVELS